MSEHENPPVPGEPLPLDKDPALAPVKTPSAVRRAVRLIVTLVLLGGGVAGFMMYKKHAKAKEAAAKVAAEANKKPQETLVRLAKTRLAQVARRERYVGELAALQIVELGPKVGGRVVKLVKELGDSVRKNELLATLDADDIHKQLLEAKTAIVVARAQVERAQADLLRTQADFDRAEVDVARNAVEANRKRPLHQQQLVTQQEMDNLDAAVALARSASRVAKTAEGVARSAVTVARAQLTQAEARIPVLKVQLDSTRILAPFAGRVNKRYLEPGSMVAPGTPIYQLVTDDNVIARFKVPERDLGELPKGKTVTLQVEAYPKDKFEGKVVRVSPAVDVATRTVIAEAETSTQGGRLKPGMFARVDVLWSVLDDVILAPQRALVRPPDDPQGTPGLYLFESGKARFVAVTTGIEQGEDVQVRGVPAGVEVIVDGQHGLKNGWAVKLAPPPGAKPAGPGAPSGAGGPPALVKPEVPFGAPPPAPPGAPAVAPSAAPQAAPPVAPAAAPASAPSSAPSTAPRKG